MRPLPACAILTVGLYSTFLSGLPLDYGKPIRVERFLDGSVRPQRYSIFLNFSSIPSELPRNLSLNHTFTYHGRCKIVIQCMQPTSGIRMHWDDLAIRKIAIYAAQGSKSLNVTGFRANGYGHANILLEEPLMVGYYVLDLEFDGQITHDLEAGLFWRNYKDFNETKLIIAALSCPIGARRIFPCFDEPDYKAKLVLEVTVPSVYQVTANAPLLQRLVSDHLQHVDIWSFEETVPMSTYLFSLSVQQYAVVTQNGRGNRVVALWAPKEDLLNHEISQMVLNVSSNALLHFEQKFGFAYPYTKLDHVVLPNVGYMNEAVAMENYGMITYQTKFLFTAPAVSVTQLINHELAHNYFGNLVTPRWWSDVWLSESFASLFQHDLQSEDWWDIYADFSCNPEEQSVITGQIVRDVDMLKPMQIFSKMAYHKGPCALHMLRTVMGSDAFDAGLREYLRTYAYSNADTSDFMAVMDIIAQQANIIGWQEQVLNVTQFLYEWLYLPGYPNVTIIRMCQDRCIWSMSQLPASQQESVKPGHADVMPVWKIPVYVESSVPNDLKNAEHNIGLTVWLTDRQSDLHVPCELCQAYLSTGQSFYDLFVIDAITDRQ